MAKVCESELKAIPVVKVKDVAVNFFIYWDQIKSLIQSFWYKEFFVFKLLILPVFELRKWSYMAKKL